MTIKGRIRAISVSAEKGTKKTNVSEAELKTDFGIVGDAHAGTLHRQVSLLAIESIQAIAAMGKSVSAGDFAENITTEGLDLRELRVGSKIKLGKTAEIEVAQFGKKCHNRCTIFNELGQCIMPREGIFATVTKSGKIRVGDIIEAVHD